VPINVHRSSIGYTKLIKNNFYARKRERENERVRERASERERERESGNFLIHL